MSWEIRSDRESDYRVLDDPGRNIVVEPLREIRRISAEDLLDEGEIRVLGYVQAYLENRVEHLARNLGSVGRQHLLNVLGERRSQITIITTDFESYTAFADLRNVVVAEKDTIGAKLKAVRVLGIPQTDAVFLCDVTLRVRA